MISTWAVFDEATYRIYGPFATKDAAEEWLAKQGIYQGQYGEQYVMLCKVYGPEHKLEEIDNG